MKPLLSLFLLGLIAATTVRGEAPRPLTLPEAIALALQNNPDLAAAEQRVKAARAALQQTEAAFWPQLKLAGTYSASDNPVQAFMMSLSQRAFDITSANFNHPDTTDNLNGRAVASVSLYNGGTDWANRQAAKLGAEAREAARDAARNDLAFEVTRSFHTITKARQFVRAAEAAVASMEANGQLVRDRHEAGQALKTDLLDAEVRLAAARENLVQARNALALSETIFRHTLGVGERDLVTAAAPTENTNDRLPVRPSAGNDFSGRPELVAAHKAVAAAERQLRAAQGGHLPKVSAFARYDFDSGDARNYEGSWLAGVNVELDVFDGFLTRGKVAAARADLEIARAALRKTELAIQLEVQQARLNLDEAQARLDTTGKAVAQAEESLQLIKERYGNGLALFTQVLDAETALTAARQRRIAAEADARIAAAALQKALGNPLE